MSSSFNVIFFCPLKSGKSLNSCSISGKTLLETCSQKKSQLVTLHKHLCKLSVYTCLRRHVYTHVCMYIYTTAHRVIYSMQPLEFQLAGSYPRRLITTRLRQCLMNRGEARPHTGKHQQLGCGEPRMLTSIKCNPSQAMMMTPSSCEYFACNKI